MNKRQLNRYFPIFVLPTFVAFCIGFIYPFLHGIYLSFCTFKTTSDAKFVGISNYIKAFADPGFLHAFWFTALFTVVSVIAINVLAFLVAYVLTSGIRGANAFRTVFFMPNLIGGVILGYIWQLIFNGILQNYGTNIKLNGGKRPRRQNAELPHRQRIAVQSACLLHFPSPSRFRVYPHGKADKISLEFLAFFCYYVF